MSYEFNSQLSTHDESSITVRERDLATEVMGEMDFGSAFYMLLTGNAPSADERRLMNAMLTSLMVHGKTPHAIATRLTLLSEPTSIQGAVASGLIGVGSRFAGSMDRCAQELQEVHETNDTNAAVEVLVTEYRDRGKPFPGIGHPHFDSVDPRAQKLFEIASEAELAGEHVEILSAVRYQFEEELGTDLLINVTGAIAAISSDMGFSPTAARGFAVVSRAAGLVAEALEEQESPMAREVWKYVDENTGHESN